MDDRDLPESTEDAVTQYFEDVMESYDVVETLTQPIPKGENA
jgi:hypothetical protein